MLISLHIYTQIYYEIQKKVFDDIYIYIADSLSIA